MAFQQASVLARLEWLATPRLTVFGGGGAVLGGTVTTEGQAHDLRPGWLATAGVSWLAAGEGARRPFVLVSGALGYATAATRLRGAGDAVLETAHWRAADGRVGVVVGKSFGPVRPYAVARAFGGPVLWRVGGADISGGDKHHYQLGAGAAFALPAGFDLDVEVVPLGEQALVAGAGFAF